MVSGLPVLSTPDGPVAWPSRQAKPVLIQNCTARHAAGIRTIRGDRRHHVFLQRCERRDLGRALFKELATDNEGLGMAPGHQCLGQDARLFLDIPKT